MRRSNCPFRGSSDLSMGDGLAATGVLIID
jgi:hypothetical protein